MLSLLFNLSELHTHLLLPNKILYYILSLFFVLSQQTRTPKVNLVVFIKFRLKLLCFPSGSAGKESACNVGDLGSIPELGRSPGEGNSYPLRYSGLENSVDCIVHEVAKSRTGLSDFHCNY